MESSKAVNYTKNSHHFNFNYSQMVDLYDQQFVSSAVFHASGHDWVIDCYPYGIPDQLLLYNYTCFLVRLQGECNKTLDLPFSCSLIKRDGTVCPLAPQILQKQGKVVFQFVQFATKIHRSYDYNDYITLHGLQMGGFINNGSFELICSVSNADKYTMVVPKSFGLHGQIGKLFESREMADVTFHVENRYFRCHRLILAAQSHVLKAELFGNMAEATQKRIKIKDMSADVFEAMLHFMYTDSFPCFDSDKTKIKMAQHLFVAADRYVVEGLKALCENLLCDSISVDTVVSTLALAEQHNSLRLKNSCLDFIAEPGTPISWMLTNEYVDLVRTFPSLMAQIRAKVDSQCLSGTLQCKKQSSIVSLH